MKRTDHRSLLGPNLDTIPKQTDRIRTGKYFTTKTEELRNLARFGLTNQEMADFYKVSLRMFQAQLSRDPELYNAIQEGKMIDSMRIVNSLHKQALGYMVKEKTVAQHVMRNGSVVETKSVTNKWIPPSVTAAIYLLKTRHGDKWMDVVKTESTKNLNISVKSVDFSDMSIEELKLLKKIGLNNMPNDFKNNRELSSGNSDIEEADVVEDE